MVMQRNHLRIFLLSFGLLCLTVSRSQQSGPPDLMIYDDALSSPWINSSWGANVTFNSTERVQTGSNSIKVALTGAWGALSVHDGNWGNSGINPASYRSLDLAVHGGTNGTSLSIFFEND